MPVVTFIHYLRTYAPAAANSSNNNNITDSPYAKDAAEGTTKKKEKKEKFAAVAAITTAAEAEAAKEDKAKGKAKTPKGELVETTALELKKLRAAAKERAKKAKTTLAAAAASIRGSRAATSREVASLSRRIRRANKLATRQLALSEWIARRLCAEDFVPLPPLSDEEITEEDESKED
ncbi:uncharacterized protein J7T54_008186 [Emericellopsis cladophorae]|uniref:Uncharacterized protein n=1 Tax=Emericellopsis cladophorae TaxID=2686198 RepID=A0A9Q0BH26_9HYPO|nr:uncharacterized protein J7T54_008186 [Emericellopsis cladophorae]KAI6785092.1 hypothetical protein J7T54_008186 [Emericellopsis cladophorae]